MYSRKLVLAIGWLHTKLRGAIALYRFRALFPQAGKNSRCPLSAEIRWPENILIGDDVAIGQGARLGGMGGIRLDDYVRISPDVTIETATLDYSGLLPYKHIAKPIHIKRGVWLCTKCTVLGGVTIGEGAIIAAGAVITKDVAPGSIVVGASNRIVGSVD